MKPKILLIEDDPSLSQIYEAEFKINGFEVITASDGEAGLNYAQEKPSLIILDIMLPKMNGLVVLEKLKKTEETKNIPVFVLTNFGQEKNVKKAYEEGAEEVIFKYQITPAEVAEKIKNYLQRR